MLEDSRLPEKHSHMEYLTGYVANQNGQSIFKSSVSVY